MSCRVAAWVRVVVQLKPKGGAYLAEPGLTLYFYYKRSADTEWIYDGWENTDQSGMAAHVYMGTMAPETYDFKVVFRGYKKDTVEYLPSEVVVTYRTKIPTKITFGG